MLSRFVRFVVQVITNTFFRRVDVVGLGNVPDAGAVIFAGNHPNALMDGWLLTARCGRWPLHFMASAKLWQYRFLRPFLDAGGAVPVYRREDHDGEVDNQGAFDKLYEVLMRGDCMGVFPEGVSHAESQLIRLKTGTARIALEVAARGSSVKIIPCGLNYLHRHRFRSQVLLEFGAPIVVDSAWADRYREDPKGTVEALTEALATALRGVTLNAPDWQTLRFVQAVRRLYKPTGAKLTPQQYVVLNRRFVEAYTNTAEDPRLRELRKSVEDYQARLDMLGLKDHQLRSEVSVGQTFRRILLRGLTMLLLLPLAIPGALLHLPVGWIAAAVGERFSYEMDDIATLKVFAAIMLLPLLYILIAIVVGTAFGWPWALAVVVMLSISFNASVRLIEAQAGLFVSILSLLRLVRLGEHVKELRDIRAALAVKIRELVNERADPSMARVFPATAFKENEPTGNP